MTAPTHRVYVALWPDAATVGAIESATGECVAESGGRAVHARHLHVTLAFIGRVASSTLGVLAHLGATIAWPRTVVRFDRLEHWPRARALVLAASEPSAPLLAARAALCAALARHRIGFDPAPFRAHVTLARGVSASAPVAPVRAVDWALTRVALVESTPTTDATDYRLLASWEAIAPDAGFQAI